MLTSAVSNLSNLIALGYPDVNASDLLQRFKLGEMGLFVDNFGMRLLRYVKNVSGSALTIGDVVVKTADVTFTDPDSATVSTITKASAFTANAHVGKILVYEVNAVAGAAPEGQSGVIVQNTASKIWIDSTYPFSAAPGTATDDAFRIWAPWHATLSAGGETAENVLGCVVASGGIADGQFGWVQFDGLHPLTKIDAAAAIAVGDAVITDVGKVVTIGAGAANLVVGYAISEAASTNSGVRPIMWTLGARGAVSL